MENVGAVLVDLNPGNFLGVDISGNVIALFDHLHPLAALGRFISKGRAKQAGPDD